MSKEIKLQLYALKGMIAELPKEDQDNIYYMVECFHTFVDDYRRENQMGTDALVGALSLIACEMQLKYMED